MKIAYKIKVLRVSVLLGCIFKALLLSTSGSIEAASGTRPNIVFFFADDLGYGDVGVYPTKHAQTPHLDRLANEGVMFTQSYVTSGFCSPSRASVITGQFPSRWSLYAHIASGQGTINANRGMPDWLPVEAPSLPRLMQAAGYRTAIFGKWHLGGGSGRVFRGIPVESPPDVPEVFAYGFDAARTFFGNSPTWLQGRPVGATHDVYPYEDQGLMTWAAEIVTNSAIEFLEIELQREETDPFMLFIWFHEPHVPLFPTAEMRAPFLHLDEPAQTHYSAIGFMDAQIGRLMQFLESNGMDENTLVIFSSDNGAHLINGGSNGYLRGTKGSTWEGGSRVPMIARWPGVIPAGHVDRQSIVSVVDFLPTFANLAGVEVPAYFEPDGFDILPVLEGVPFARPAPLFWHSLPHSWHPEWAVRKGDWKLLEDADGGRLHLFNLVEDPSEMNNLANENPTMVAKLRKHLQNWRNELPKSWQVAPKVEVPMPQETMIGPPR